jgi:hypothetical protein
VQSLAGGRRLPLPMTFRRGGVLFRPPAIRWGLRRFPETAMRRLALCVIGSALLVSMTSTPVATVEQGTALLPAEKAAGWVSLFDGQSLDAWRAYRRDDAARTRWAVNPDGTLCVGNRTRQDTLEQRDLITRATYDQFELRWEWRVEEGGNSGVKYFVLEDQNSAIGHEYQMIDDARHPDAKRGPKWQTGGLYDVLAAANRPVKPAGEWNESRILVSGEKVEHWLNGAKVLEYELGSPALKAAIAESKFNNIARFGTRQKAHILLQDHGEAVCYRRIAVRPTAR